MSGETSKKQIYIPGLSVEEVKKKYSLDTVYKLAGNENPLPLPEELLKDLQNHLQSISGYPSYMRPVTEAVSRYYEVDRDHVLIGNGSSELIDKLTQTYGAGGGAVLISEKSFPLYEFCARARGLDLYKARMDKNLKINIPEILRLLRAHKNIRLIFISNPNNPTGSYTTHQELEHLLAETKGRNLPVVLDEAYWGYARAKDFASAQALFKKYPHLILLRSLSKIMGLAGLRAGIMLAHPFVTKKVKPAIYPFNVNIMAVRAIMFCMSDKPSIKKYLSDSKKLVWSSLDYFYKELKNAGLRFYPSQGNFILFSTGKKTGQEAFSALLKRGLILRPLQDPGLENYLRMSIGLPDENKKAIELIKEVCR